MSKYLSQPAVRKNRTTIEQCSESEKSKQHFGEAATLCGAYFTC